MTYKRKTRDEFDLRANYGFGEGFEAIDCHETRKDAIAARKVYRANGDFAPMKIVRVRVPIVLATVESEAN